MPIIRIQVAAAADTLLARDQLVNTFHFNVLSASPDYNALCTDLATIMANWFDVPRQVRAVAYEVAGPPPHYPVGEALLSSGVAPASGRPREVALCLSYYAERNVKRRRGRIFLPVGAYISTTMSGRPDAALMTKTLNLGTSLSGLGGANVDWVVYSRLDIEHRKVTNVWVDNEWDTVRSRGLRGTSRQLLAVSG